MNLIDKLEQLAASATPEPWSQRDYWKLTECCDNNAALILTMRNALPALLRLARAAVAWRKRANEATHAALFDAADALAKEQQP